MDMPVNVPVGDPNADTEWNDILRKHGVIPEKPPSPTHAIEEAITEARRLAHENRLEGKDLDELDELEDEEDEAFLDQYRKRRLAELTNISRSSIYNQVYHIQKPDYSRDVTETSKTSSVVVLLTSSVDTNNESALLITLWRQLASTFGDIKFCQMRANLCIEGYPDKNTPTILMYRDGDIRKQIITLKELKGQETRLEDVERLLVNVGALTMGDPRLSRSISSRVDRSDTENRPKIRSSKLKDEEDSDWE